MASLIETKTMKIKIIFTIKKTCYKFIIDLDKVTISEILMCLEEQFKLE